METTKRRPDRLPVLFMVADVESRDTFRVFVVAGKEGIENPIARVVGCNDEIEAIAEVIKRNGWDSARVNLKAFRESDITAEQMAGAKRFIASDAERQSRERQDEAHRNRDEAIARDPRAAEGVAAVVGDLPPGVITEPVPGGVPETVPAELGETVPEQTTEEKPEPEAEHPHKSHHKKVHK